MMKKSNFKYVILLFVLTIFTACGDDDEKYDADAAISYYTPTDYRKISSIKTSKTTGGKNYSWKYDFAYDVKGRIKQINGDIVHYDKSELCNISTTANYFYNGAQLKVTYRLEFVYPKNSNKNSTRSGQYGGRFKSDGVLEAFGPFDCGYSGLNLTFGYLEGGDKYQLFRDRYNNITGYDYTNGGSDSTYFYRDIYKYTPDKNNTNIDFVSFYGHIPLERYLAYCEQSLYAPFHLGAFDMMGARSTELPEAVWQFERGYPVAATDLTLTTVNNNKVSNSKGYSVAITYVDE